MMSSIKLMLVGDPGCGKAQIFNRLIGTPFQDEHSVGSTWIHVINMEPSTLPEGIPNQVLVQAHRMSNPQAHKRSEGYRPSAYQNINILMVVYDVTNRQSFESCQAWLDEFSRDNPRALKVLVGAKADLLKENDKSQVTDKEALEFKKKNNMDEYVKLTAKNWSVHATPKFLKTTLLKWQAKEELTRNVIPGEAKRTDTTVFSSTPQLIIEQNTTAVAEFKRALSKPPADWKESATIGAIFGAGTAAVGVSILVGALSVSTLGMGLLIGCGVFFLACMIKAISDYRAKKSYLANQGLYHIKQEQPQAENAPASPKIVLPSVAPAAR